MREYRTKKRVESANHAKDLTSSFSPLSFRFFIELYDTREKENV